MNIKTSADLWHPIEYVVYHSQHVAINHEAIDSFATDFTPTSEKVWNKAYEFDYQPPEELEDLLLFRFLADAQAFYFWGYPKKWTVEYQNKILDGWWALLASLQRALENKIPILNPDYLANMTQVQAQAIFNGKPQIPLLKERVVIFNEIGTVLQTTSHKKLHSLIISPSEDAFSSMIRIIELFPLSFDDTAHYKGKQIPFFKKAQLLMADLDQILRDNNRPGFKGLDKLIGKADYKIPWLLREHEILEYTNPLENLVNNRKTIKAGSEMEIEIRANMLWANKLICQALKPKHPNITPLQLDFMLWTLSQDKPANANPYHLTKTTAY